MDQQRLEVETLLAQSGWLRALAIRLVYDENRADDLVQQVWLQAVERPPRREGSVRGWLRAALRSRWRDQQRSEAARGARERATFEERTAPATAEIAARVEAQQTVARAVLKLDEPLREVVLLHFFEELPLREVARRLDLPYETVRHRVTRALEALRTQLKAAHGEDESRRMALLLVAHGASTPPSTAAAAGARLRKLPRWVAAGVAASLLGAAVLVVALSSPRESAESPGPRASESAAVAPQARTNDSAGTSRSGSAAESPAVNAGKSRARAEVRVRTVEGEAVAQAKVEAWTVPARPDGATTRVAVATTDRDGRVHFEGLAPGRFTFVARASGHALASALDRRLDAADAPHQFEILIGPGFALTGRVVDEDGHAVAGAVLVAEPPRQPWDLMRAVLRAETAADAEGRYDFESLTPGEITLSIAFPGGVPTPAATVSLPCVTTFDVQLRHGGTIRGRVTDEATGTPVADAEVRVYGWPAIEAPIGRAVTGADGGYTVGALIDGVVRQVVAEKDGYAIDAPADQRTSPTAMIALPRGTTLTRDLVLRRGGRLSGHVTGPAGSVAGAAVTVTFANRLGGWSVRSATTSEDGGYGVDHVAAGQAFVRIEAPGLKEKVLADPKVANSISLEPFAANVTEGGAAIFDVAMIVDDAPAAPPAGRVRGVLVGEDGQTPRGAWVELAASSNGVAGLAQERVLVSRDGTFELAAPPAPATALRVRASGPELADCWSAEVALAAVNDAAPLRMQLERGTSLVGEVRRSGTAAPVAGAQVRISTPRENGRFARRAIGSLAPIVAVTGIDGRFVVSCLRAGTYEVAVEAEGSIASVRTLDVPSADAVLFDLAPSMEIAGRVAFADGTPVPGAHVAAAPETPGKVPAAGASSATATQDGSFVIRGLAAGRYRLHVDGSSDRSLSFTQPAADPVEAGTRNAHVLVERALEIAGRVLDAHGQPVRGVAVSLEAPGARVAPVGTDADGAFAFTALRAGTYAVAAQTLAQGADVQIARREGVAAGTRGVELVLVAALSIEGVVLDAEGHEVPGAAVAASPTDRAPSGNPLGFRPVGPGGRFALHGLAAGSYEISVGNLRDRLRPLVVRGTRQFIAGATDVRLEVHPALTVSGRLVDAHGDPVTGRVIEFIPDETVWPTRRVRTSATGDFTCDGLGPGRHRAELVDGDGASAQRVPCGECDAGATGIEWRIR